jgi:large subunit ribosomal protein L19
MTKITETAKYPKVVPGAIVRVQQKIKEKNPKGVEKERIQTFEGMVIARRHGSQPGATITVRKMSDGIGVEKIYPLFSPIVMDIEVVKTMQVRRSKLYFTKNYKKRFKEKIDKNNPVKAKSKAKAKK